MPSNGSAASISLPMQRMSNCPCENFNQVSVFMMSEVHIHVVEWQHIKNFKKMTKQPLISRWGSWDKYVIDCVQAWHLQRQVSPLIKGLTNTVCKWRNKRFFFSHLCHLHSFLLFISNSQVAFFWRYEVHSGHLQKFPTPVRSTHLHWTMPMGKKIKDTCTLTRRREKKEQYCYK